MRVVITGGAGFIGSRLCARLAQRGDEITVFDPCLGEAHRGLGTVVIEGASLVLADPRQAAQAFVDAAGDADAVFHLAALTGTGQSMYEVTRYTDTNVGLTAWLAELLVEGEIRPGRVAFASSRAVYGEGAGRCPVHGRAPLRPRRAPALAARRWNPPCALCGAEAEPLPLREDDHAQPRSIYGATKLAGEGLLALAGETAGVPVTRLRLFNVYGPGQPPTNPYVGVTAAFLQAALHGEAIEVFEEGGIVRDLVYVDDCVDALLATVDRPVAFDGVLNIGSETPTRLDDIARCASQLAGGGVEVRVSSRARVGDPRSAVADASAARVELGWRATTTPAVGLGRTFRWLRDLALPSQVAALDAALGELERRALLAEGAS